MSVKVYFSICVLVAIAALLFFATGNFTMFMAVVFGFIAFGLTFMGMMNILPIVVTHPAPARSVEPKPISIPQETTVPAAAFNRLKSA